MKLVSLIASVAIAFATISPAGAAEVLLKPTQLNPNLPPDVGAKLDRAFARLTGARANANARALVPETNVLVTDPESHKSAKADDLAAAVIRIQQLWFKRTGRHLKPGEGTRQHPLDLNVLSGRKLPVTRFRIKEGRNAANLSRVAVATSVLGVSNLSLPLAPTDPCAGAPQPSKDPAADLSAAWKAVDAYRKLAAGATQDAQLKLLPFCSLIDKLSGSSGGTPLTIPPLVATFGDPQYAQGTFTVTPSIDLTNGITAKLEAQFGASLIKQKRDKILDGVATVIVPAQNSKDPIKTTITVGGDAFPDNSGFTESHSFGNGSISYTGQPVKDFTFYQFSQTFGAGAGVTLTCDVNVSGKTGLSYELDGGANGLYGTVKPHVEATAAGSVKASALVANAAVEASVTVQNGDSAIAALITPIPYKNRLYAVQRIAVNYAPFQYQAKIIATGHLLLGLFYFRAPIADTGDKIDVGSFISDSGWAVQGPI